jgi:ZIP family zinc transporter/zinc and cadmium transporter
VAAGVILSVAFFGLMGEAIDNNPHALLYVFAGFVAFYLMETFAVLHSGAEVHVAASADHVHAARGSIIFTGLLLHSLVDGIIIGAGFEVSPQLGALTAASISLHSLPEGVTTFALLSQRMSRRASIGMSMAVGLAKPLSCTIAVLLWAGMTQQTAGALLGLAAGSFLYVGASDLVPETHTRKGWLTAVLFVGGAFLAYLILSHFTHGH